jgi:hydrophobe/amphiphile efflux-3 (HAE3) family protein
MLESLGKTVTLKPWTIVTIIILITFGFSTLLPSLEMKTSMDDFLPDNDVVVADERIQEYFGASNEVIMVLAEVEDKNTLLSPEGLKKLFQISEELTEMDDIDDVMSIAGFVDLVCGLEYNKSLPDCSDEEIQSAYFDLMTDPLNEPLRMHNIDDANEDVDFQRFQRLSRKTSVDTLDAKNLEIQQNDSHICFSILLHDASNIESLLMTRGLKVNVIEWFVSFQNIIGPPKLQEMQYRISAHLEPCEEIWEYGKGIISNINHLLKSITTRTIRNCYTLQPILWITPPEQDIAFPVFLKTGNITWKPSDNVIFLSISREELGRNGIGFETNNFGMPARIGNLYCGVRTYQFSLLNIPWKRSSLNINATEKAFQFIQQRPLLGNMGERILSKNLDLRWDDVNGMLDMMNQQMKGINAWSLTQMDQFYVETDRAPDSGVMDKTFFLKPSFLIDIQDSVINFLSKDFNLNEGASAALMMVNINESVNVTQLNTISQDIVDLLDDTSKEYSDIQFQATGNSIIEYEINEISMEANSLIIPLIFVVISIILFVSFRKLSYVILPLAGLTFAIIWMFGSMILLNMPFMVMEVALIPMLMGLGVDYSVHLYHNYRVEKGKGFNAKQAIENSIRDIGVAMLLATATTFIAFLSFLTATMIPLRDFGVLCAVGIAYVFAITLTFQAAMRYIIDRRNEKQHQRKGITSKKKEYGKIMRRIARFVCNHPLPILLTTILISGVMGYGAMQIETGFAMEDFLPEENPSVIVMNIILDEFPFASQEKEYILIEKIDVATVQNLQDIYQVIDNCEDDKFVMIQRDGFPKTDSILNIIEDAVQDNTSLIQKFSLNEKLVPSSNTEVKALFDYLYNHENYKNLMQTYIHLSEQGVYDATVIHIYTDAYGSNGEDVSNVMKTIYEDLNADVMTLFPDEAKVTVTGDNSMMHVIMNSMTESQLVSTLVCLVLAVVVLIIAYRNPILGIVTMIPVSVSMLWIIGAMYFIGYTLNVMTIMITSLTIGLGITYAIHAVERFRLYANNTGDVIGAVSETIGHTGGALLISAVTTMIGFGMLVFTPMPVEQQFGIITALTIAFAFLTSIFILPPVLLFWGRWRKNHKGYVISKGDPRNNEK